jgi:hypothetical protein
MTTDRLIKHLAAEAFEEKPRASPNTRGSKISTSGMSVLIIFILYARLLARNFNDHALHTLTPVRERHTKYRWNFHSTGGSSADVLPALDRPLSGSR